VLLRQRRPGKPDQRVQVGDGGGPLELRHLPGQSVPAGAARGGLSAVSGSATRPANRRPGARVGPGAGGHAAQSVPAGGGARAGALSGHSPSLVQQLSVPRTVGWLGGKAGDRRDMTRSGRRPERSKQTGTAREDGAAWDAPGLGAGRRENPEER